MAEDRAAVSQLVVVGASAGGIEALSSLLFTLPADFPAPIVIAQHLDPTRASHLEEILARSTGLQVRTVTEGAPLERGVVYVVPANRHVEITNHSVGLADSGDQARPKPSIDLLLGTAAQVFGEALYAVILTGTGTDGADGARQVKEAGGTVIIQNPETASFPSMPLSLAPTTVDIVADLEAIGPLLHDLLTGAYSPPSPDADRRMRTLLDQLRTRSGIDFSQYRRPTIRRRLERRMAHTGKQTLDEYLGYLRHNPEEYQRLASSFLIKVTDFFRDVELFDYLRERLLPELIAEARKHDNELRCWSAGCATGEEAYSLAILIAELLGDDLEGFSVRVYATDVDPDAVAYARHGVYPASAVRGLPPELIGRYFAEQDGAYEVKKYVRRLVVFAPHDLSQRAPFPRIDLALCRNVLIYFTPELQRRALQLFAFSLRPGGRLILGKSETTGSLSEYYALEQPRLKIYRRQGEQVLLTQRDIKRTAPGRELAATPRPRLPDPEPATARAQHGWPAPGGSARDTAERLLLDLPVGVVVVDPHYDVQAINAAARRLLSIHSVAVAEDLIHTARRVRGERLRGAIDQALSGHQATERLEVETLEGAPGERRIVEITCYPQPSETSQQTVDRVMILISDVSPAASQPPAPEPEHAPQRVQLERLLAGAQTLAKRLPGEARALLAEARTGLEEDLRELERLSATLRQLEVARQELLRANQQLTATNTELMSQNEELAVATEEAQAAIEEVETLSEEQQASNEELETLNEELQATIEELHTTNDDLESRGQELQETARSLEAERARLAAVLAGIGDAVLVLDRTGRPILTNAAFDRSFGSADFVPEDEQGQPLPPEARPQQRAAAGETVSMSFTMAQPDGTRRWFEANVQPIQGHGEGSSVLVIRDISERSLLRLQNEFLALASHELNTPLTALSGSLQMLARQARSSGDERPRHYTEIGMNQVRLLADLIRDLTDAVRLQEGRFHVEPQPLDLVPLAREAIEVVQVQAAGPIFRFSSRAPSLIVNGDPQRLQQVLVNLLTNALKYAPGSERVDVRLRPVDDQAEIEVRDYGPGISQADLERVFSRFFQVGHEGNRAGGGLGLGLYISREIVRAHGGAISVSSPEGGGASFIIRLPLAEPSRPPPASRVLGS